MEICNGLALIVFTICGLGGLAVSDEKRLIKQLVDDYAKVGRVGRPVVRTNQTMNVKYGLALIQILDLDERNQVLTANYWNRYSWEDRLLRWDPEKYGGVLEVRIPVSEIWLPDILLYNYADDRLKERRDAMAVVQHTGNIQWIPQAIFKSSCSIDIKNFPFDEQTCHLKFGSWTYDGYKLDIDFYQDLEEVDMTDYVKSNEWHIVEHPAKKNIKKYPCCDTPFPDLTFTIRIRRKVAFYNYILILPCVLLSSLTLVLFWLPPESPAKMQLGMNIFVAFFLLLLLLTENTPPASASIPLIGMNIFVAFFVLLLLLADSTPPASASIPLIGAYYCLNMILITLSTFLSVIVIQLYFRGDSSTRVPRWIKRIMVDGLARVLCMGVDRPKDDKNEDLHVHTNEGQAQVTRDLKTMRQKGKEMKYNKYQMVDTTVSFSDNVGITRANGKYEPSPDMSPIHFNQGVETDVKEIRKILKHMVIKMQNKEMIAKIQKEWKIVALVLDRIFFILYLIAIIVSLCTIFPKTG